MHTVHAELENVRKVVWLCYMEECVRESTNEFFCENHNGELDVTREETRREALKLFNDAFIPLQQRPENRRHFSTAISGIACECCGKTSNQIVGHLETTDN